MKLISLITIIAFPLASFAQGKEQPVKLKPACTEKSFYYHPNYQTETHHSIEGIGNLYKPADSITDRTIFITGYIDQATEDSLISKSNRTNNNLTVIVDTSLCILKEIKLYKTTTPDKTFSSYPRTLRLKRKDGTVSIKPLKKEISMNVIAQPVFITNTSDEVKYLVSYSGNLSITQQAKDKNNTWIDIETTIPAGCSMVKYICELKPNDFVLTTVYRFKGTYQTELRIKVETDNFTLYSEPFMGQINYEQLHNPKIKLIDNIPYERF